MEYFTITQCDNTGAGLTTYPIMFTNYNDAKNYLDYIRNMSFTYTISKNVSHVHFNSSVHSASSAPNSHTHFNTESDSSLSGYTLRYHKNCIVMSHPEETPRPYFYGKEFNSGWWNEKLSGWIFQKEHENYLLERGATFSSEHHTHHEPDIDSHNHSHTQDNHESLDEDEHPLSGYVVYKYKRGYILKCDFAEQTDYFWDGHTDCGFWNKNQQGWFFQKEYLDELLEAGAELVDGPSNGNFENTKWVAYGRGWVLKPTKKHPNYGEKYFGDYNGGGWWMSHQNGWFFKDSVYQSIVNN